MAFTPPHLGTRQPAATASAARHGVAFEDLTTPINVCANEIRDERQEVERDLDLEWEKEREAAERSRDGGMDFGL